jgi:hypothetical protein
MKLEQAVKLATHAHTRLIEDQAISDPRYMSEWMMRLAQYNSEVEIHLAEYKRRYEIQKGALLTKYMINEGLRPTAADKRVRIDIADTQSKVEYLAEFTKANWNLISTIQSRYNHLQKNNVGQV